MLSNNQLKQPPTNMASLTKLEVLRLANNQIPASVLHGLPKLVPSLKWLAASDNPKPFDFLQSENVKVIKWHEKESLSHSYDYFGNKDFLLSKEEALVLPKAVASGMRLGEGSAGVSYKIFFRGETVIYKQFKSLLTTDGRIESEIAHAAAIKPKGMNKLSQN